MPTSSRRNCPTFHPAISSMAKYALRNLAATCRVGMPDLGVHLQTSVRATRTTSTALYWPPAMRNAAGGRWRRPRARTSCSGSPPASWSNRSTCALSRRWIPASRWRRRVVMCKAQPATSITTRQWPARWRDVHSRSVKTTSAGRCVNRLASPHTSSPGISRPPRSRAVWRRPWPPVAQWSPNPRRPPHSRHCFWPRSSSTAASRPGW